MIILLGAILALGGNFLWRSRPILTIRPHGGRPVNGLAFSPDCSLLATIGDHGQFSLWEVPTGREKHTFPVHSAAGTCVAFLPNGDTLITGGLDGRIAFWDLQTGQETGSVFHYWAHGVAVSPDSRLVATVGADGWLKVWDIATRKECLNFNVPRTPLCSVAYAPDGKHLAAGDADDIVHLLDAENGRQVATINTDPGGVNLGLTFSPDGKLLAVEGPGRAIQLIDVATGQPALQFPPAHSCGISCMAFSNDGKLLASSSGTPRRAGEVIVWDAERAKELIKLRGHDEGYTAVCFSRNGKYLATASRDGTVDLWELGRLLPAGR
ncbi:MAG TPA: WD40 repeat domain-containing protein [Gemmataceae bacterium]|nr:WD40 repeat domain-containing protein [Gemmataceae bacterium]